VKKISIYTDGACSGNPGPGGWGAVLIYGEKEKHISGSDTETTNNRMELMAAISALESVKEKCEIDLYTDSKYVLQGITEWLPNWKAKGWKGANKKPIKNVDLWQRLDETNAQHHVKWHWVKGHNGNKYNEIADTLATTAIK